MPIRALIRGVPDSFVHALSAAPREGASAQIDVRLAREQHAAYRAALEASGAIVMELPADERFPDCVFVEDTAVVVGWPGESGGGRPGEGSAGAGEAGVGGVGGGERGGEGAGGRLALVTRPGAPSRRGEVDGVAAELARYLELVRIEEPATLEGGDCMWLGRTLYIGRSARTNAAGIARAEAVLAPRGYRIVPVELPPDVLHLKCVCSPLGDGRVLLAEGTLAEELFDAGIVWVPAKERYAANAVAVGEHVVAAAEYPRTLAALEAAGLRVHPVPTSEVRKADGSLTCQSIVF